LNHEATAGRIARFDKLRGTEVGLDVSYNILGVSVSYFRDDTKTA
jgi:hypothetical protein